MGVYFFKHFFKWKKMYKQSAILPRNGEEPSWPVVFSRLKEIVTASSFSGQDLASVNISTNFAVRVPDAGGLAKQLQVTDYNLDYSNRVPSNFKAPHDGEGEIDKRTLRKAEIHERGRLNIEFFIYHWILLEEMNSLFYPVLILIFS